MNGRISRRATLLMIQTTELLVKFTVLPMILPVLVSGMRTSFIFTNTPRWLDGTNGLSMISGIETPTSAYIISRDGCKLLRTFVTAKALFAIYSNNLMSLPTEPPNQLMTSSTASRHFPTLWIHRLKPRPIFLKKFILHSPACVHLFLQRRRRVWPEMFHLQLQSL